MELKQIQTVKIQGEGYLLNGNMSVPKADGNREYELIKEWLAEGNTPESEFTEAELAQQELEAKIAEAKAYLESTDFKMTVDYYATLTPEQQEGLIDKRAEAREYVRVNDVSNS